MEKPRIRHIAINVEDLDKTAEYYKRVFGMEEKHRQPGEPFIYPTYLDRSHPYREISVESITLVSKSIASKKSRKLPTQSEDNTYGAIAESWIKDVEGNRVDVSEHGWPV